MNKKIKGLLLTTAGVTVIAATAIVMMSPKSLVSKEPNSAADLSDKPEVKVQINTQREDIPVYEEITDEETGETVMAEVQENVPAQPKPTVPPEKPKAEGDYTNPAAPPVYTEEQTVVTQPLPNQDHSQEHSSSKVQDSTSEPQKDQVYIEGFGYVSESGNAQTQTIISDGDMNKQVGSMD